MRLLYVIIILSILSCDTPEKLDNRLVKSYKRYLFIQKLSEDSLITNTLSSFYLDSLNVNKLEFNLFKNKFNNDILFRKIVLKEMTYNVDSLLYRTIYDSICTLKKKYKEGNETYFNLIHQCLWDKKLNSFFKYS